MEHELKCWPESYDLIIKGLKPYVSQKEGDRTFLVGDVLKLRAFIPCSHCQGTGGSQEDPCCQPPFGRYRGDFVRAHVLSVVRGWGLPAGMVVMGLSVGLPVVEKSR